MSPARSGNIRRYAAVNGSRKDAKVAKGEILMHLEFKKISKVLSALGTLARDRTYASRLATYGLSDTIEFSP
jgi:uncharacterized protein (DUF169 family)